MRLIGCLLALAAGLLFAVLDEEPAPRRPR